MAEAVAHAATITLLADAIEQMRSPASSTQVFNPFDSDEHSAYLQNQECQLTAPYLLLLMISGIATSLHSPLFCFPPTQSQRGKWSLGTPQIIVSSK